MRRKVIFNMLNDFRIERRRRIREDMKSLAEEYFDHWLIPVLLIPKPLSPALIYNHAMFLVLYLTSFFLERKPCTICSIVFLAAVFLICYSCVGNCILWQCPDQDCQSEDGGVC